jgi:rhodanese-related sulfurtransferase
VDFVLNNIWLVLIAVTSGLMLVWPMVTQRAGGLSVSTLQATQLINHRDALVLDVRSADDFARGHILNARNIPAKQLGERLADLEKFRARPIIVSCQTGASATASCSLLKKAGFTEVRLLAGGISAWEQAGLPVTK